MTSWTTRALFAFFLCFSQVKAQQPPVVVGAVVSQTGMHAPLAAGYAQGLLLWQGEANAAGGLLGRPVELRLLDDGSDAVRAGELYRQLIGEAKADLLIGPYGSAATRMAAADADRARRVLINGAGPAQAVQQGSNRYLFQTGGPYTAEGGGLLQLLKAQGMTRLHILARQELVTREMAEAMRIAALAQGFSVPEVEPYALQTIDFAPHVIRAEIEQAQAWIAFGEARDAAEMVKTFKKLGYAPGLFFARKAADPAFVAAVGQDAEYTLAAVDYDPRMARPANSAFVKAFTARWSTAPGLAAAQGYAAASVLAEAVRRAGTLDQEKLRATLAGMEMETVLGAYRVGKNGEQLGVSAAVAQIQRGRAEIVWPPGLETAKPLQPYPRWKERQVLK